MSSQPLVSVIMPAYNAGRWIGLALTSALAQTHTYFEAIVVDDGSTDDTAAIVESFMRRDGRIRLVRQKNGGVAAARNRGIAEARGEYIAPLDADDIWLPENLARQVRALEEMGSATPFSYARSFRIDEHQRLLPEWRLSRHAPPADYISLLRNNWVGCGSAAVFRKAALLAAGGYDETLRARGAQGAEDWKLVLLLASKAPGVAINDSLIGYRTSSAAMSKNLHSMKKSVLLVIEEMRSIGPPIGSWNFRAARSSILIWLVPICIESREWREAACCLVDAYLGNPLWITQRVAWRLLFRIFRKVLVRSWLPLSPTYAWPIENQAAVQNENSRSHRGSA